MTEFRGKSVQAMVRDIADGYVSVNPIFLKFFGDEGLKVLFQQIHKIQAEVRGPPFPSQQHRDSNGDFVWAKGMGGPKDVFNSGEDYGYEISVDTSGNVYTTGEFYGTVDFDPGMGTFNLISSGITDVFISKLDSNGDFVWAKGIGGVGFDGGGAIILDNIGNVYTSGTFKSTADFDPGVGTFNLTSAGLRDIFVSKLDNSGSFVWAKSIGGPEEDSVGNIIVDLGGNVYTTGYFSGIADFDRGVSTFNLTSAGSFDIFISKLDGNANFVWAKSMGGLGQDRGSGIALDSSGNVYTTGYFESTADFDPGAGINNLTSAGGGRYLRFEVVGKSI